MPSYNAGLFIRAAIESVRAQSYSDWQLVVVDDHSTDGTADILADMSRDDPRLLVKHVQSEGIVARSRNRAMAFAQGEFVAFLDADDVWMPDKLEDQVHFFGEHPEAGLVFGLSRILRAGEVVSQNIFPDARRLPNPGDYFGRLCLRNWIPNSSVMLRRELVERVGPLDEDPRLRGTEDYEYWLRLAPHTLFGFVDRPVFLYRVHEGGLSRQFLRQAEGGFLAVRKAIERDPKALNRLRLNWERVCGLWLQRVAQAELLEGKPGRGLGNLVRSLRLHPLNPRAWACLGAALAGPRAARFAFRHLSPMAV